MRDKREIEFTLHTERAIRDAMIARGTGSASDEVNWQIIGRIQYRIDAMVWVLNPDIIGTEPNLTDAPGQLVVQHLIAAGNQDWSRHEPLPDTRDKRIAEWIVDGTRVKCPYCAAIADLEDAR